MFMLEDVINKLTFINQRVHEDALNSNVVGAFNASTLAWYEVV